jgi:hypothetical protein
LAPEAGGDTFTWVVDAYGILGIHRLQTSQKTSLHPKDSQYLPQHFTRHNIERFLEINKIEIKFFFALLCSIRVRNMKSWLVVR